MPQESINKLHNSICAGFVRDYLSYAAKLDSNKKYTFMEIMGAEGKGVKILWGLLPYVNDSLKKANNSSEQAMTQIFNWIKKAYNTLSEEQKQYPSLDLPRNILPYTQYVQLAHFDNVLGYDERMPSHLLAKLLSLEVVEELQKNR